MEFPTFAVRTLPRSAAALRREVRRLIAAWQPKFRHPPVDGWMVADPAFSRALGERGWIGMTWPKRYGGGERSFLERHLVAEELLAAGAPVGAHWIADRQTGPLLLRYGTEEQRRSFLPRIAAGTCYFAIGMSEPEAGSDLAAVRTRAVRTSRGWRVTGSKIWTSFARFCHHMICLVRTGEPNGDRHAGLSQLIIDLDAPGVTIRPIANLAGDLSFHQIFLDEVEVPENRLVGKEGEGWLQVRSELAYERSGPERILSTFALLPLLARGARERPDARRALGRAIAQLMVLREMSRSVSGSLDAGHVPDLEGALVKDLGTSFEQQLPETVREHLGVEPDPSAPPDRAERLLATAILHAPSFSLRGGTREVLRSIIAGGLGLR